MAQELPGTEESVVPRVSVVLVAFHQLEELRRAIGALEKSQDRAQLEILVLDCGSQDGTAEIDTEFPSVSVLRMPHHVGSTKAMNIGVRTAKAELVMFLSPDIEVLPDTISRLAARLEQDSDAAVACPLLVNPAGEPVPQAFRYPMQDTLASGELVPMALDLEQESIAVEYPGRHALLVRKQFMRTINFFDEHFGEYWADADFAVKVRQAGKKIRLYPSIRVVLHPSEDPLAGDSLADADKTLGAAEYIGKYQGFFAGATFRLSALLKALLSFNFRRFSLLLSGQKLDGTQAG
jgi:hypothetical protein